MVTEKNAKNAKLHEWHDPFSFKQVQDACLKYDCGFPEALEHLRKQTLGGY